MQTFLFIILVFAIAISGIGIRLFLVKGGEVRGGCAGKNPILQEEGVTCSFCGAPTGEACRKDDIPEEGRSVKA